MIKIGILAFGRKDDGGVYQYAQSIIDALKEDKNKIYIIFCNKNDDRFDKYDLEIRKIDKPQNKISEKIIRIFQQLFFIRNPWFFTKKELDIFADIDMFLSADKLIKDIKDKVEEQEEKIKLIDTTAKNIINASFNISNAIKWKKFLSGDLS